MHAGNGAKGDSSGVSCAKTVAISTKNKDATAVEIIVSISLNKERKTLLNLKTR